MVMAALDARRTYIACSGAECITKEKIRKSLTHLRNRIPRDTDEVLS